MSGFVKLVSAGIIASASMALVAVELHESRAKKAEAAALAGRPAAPTAVPATDNAMIYADARGHFMADLYVRGIPIRALVDTGATLVSFSEEDAGKIGLRAEPGQRKAQFQTANGVVTASIVRVPEMRLQGIRLFDVEAAIMPKGAMQGTLLGMSFMKKLASYESRGTSMVLRR